MFAAHRPLPAACRLALFTLALLPGAGCEPEPAAAGTGAPSRVISTAPSITEMVYALGADDRLVGVTTYCRYPPAALDKPRIGSFAAPSMEAVLARTPDLIMALSDRQDLETRFRSAGLAVLMLDVRDLSGVLASIELLGRSLGVPERGEALAGRLRDELAARRSRWRSEPPREVLVLVGRNPGNITDLYAVGGRSYLADLVEIAGGRSVFREAGALYPKVSIEEILVRDPELIIDLSQMGRSPTADDLDRVRRLWRDFPRLQAVRENRVFVLDDDVLLVPGPRMIEAVDRLRALIASALP